MNITQNVLTRGNRLTVKCRHLHFSVLICLPIGLNHNKSALNGQQTNRIFEKRLNHPQS